MFGAGKTYFADSPVVIEVSGLRWPATSPFKIVRLEVIYGNALVGMLRVDTGGQTAISFNVSTALKAIWSDYTFSTEVAKAQAALTAGAGQSAARNMRQYSLRVFTEYISSDDGGVYTETQYEDAQGNKTIPGGQCIIGAWTEWERYIKADVSEADVSSLEHTGGRYGDASTKPVTSPERVGRDSITSWVDVQSGQTRSIFYPSSVTPEPDDTPQAGSWTGHAPIVLRDSQEYVDFLFVNRRGAVETCSAQMKEAMSITVETQHYARIEGPSFKPSRTLMAIAEGGRRSWSMSSGMQMREWTEWWTEEFLMARQWWMLYQGSYVPVIVEPAKKQITVYDKAKQQMASVDFTVTLALQG